LTDSRDDGGEVPSEPAPPLPGIGRRVTLTRGVRAIRLPGEDDPAGSSPPAPAKILPLAEPIPETERLDAWNEDRLRRSSLPPAGAKQHIPKVPRTSAPPSAPKSESPGAESLRESAGDALDLVRRSSTASPRVDLVSEMTERFALDDFTGALRAAEFVLGTDPDNILAGHYASVSRQKLEALLYARLTKGGSVPRTTVAESEIQWLGLDAQTGFLLSRVDGHTDCEAIMAGSGLSRLEALKGLLELVDASVIALGLRS